MGIQQNKHFQANGKSGSQEKVRFQSFPVPSKANGSVMKRYSFFPLNVCRKNPQLASGPSFPVWFDRNSTKRERR
jgi:hypothetical protein